MTISSWLGIPEEALSDQGTQIMTDCIRKVHCLLGIKQRMTTPYHPMCNSLMERFNATLKICFRRLCDANQLKNFILRETANDETPTGDGSVPAASLAVVEADDQGSSYDACSCEVLSQLGCWGSKETVKNLKLGHELTTEQ
ncbi:Zinc finger protein [Plakobranchus ocellatus]|uniref:Zinc finger protein n=1 Tax=Plakobranchus ocellatus TaxID=259542 RepID=A0AAV4CWG7_9GAST|nr:Zinc finger protein [Plakobranchus ocellatus]